MQKFVGYARTSTSRQELGLEAQRRRIVEFAGGENAVLAIFEEQESGACSERPELEAALTQCELTGAVLLIASLDRLSRDVLFLEALKRRCEAGGFGFKCVDMPDADALTLGIMIQLAQWERQKISERTRAALMQAKANGRKLGGAAERHPGATAFRGRQRAGWKRAGQIHKAAADHWAEKRREVLRDLVSRGMNNAQIARAFQAQGVLTRRGKTSWSARQVIDLRRRLGLYDVAARRPQTVQGDGINRVSDNLQTRP